MAKIYIKSLKDLEEKIEKYASLYLVVYDKFGKKIICEGNGKEVEVIVLNENMLSKVNNGDLVKVLGIPFKKGDKIIVRAYIVRKIEKSEIELKTLKEVLEIGNKIF